MKVLTQSGENTGWLLVCHQGKVEPVLTERQLGATLSGRPVSTQQGLPSVHSTRGQAPHRVLSDRGCTAATRPAVRKPPTRHQKEDASLPAWDRS